MAGRAGRLRLLLALEIHRVSDDLLRRRDLLLEVWGRHRSRSPFLDTTFQRYRTLAMGELLELESREIEVVESFYRELNDLRFYLAHTDDMPRALSMVLDSSLARLRAAARLALGELATQVELRHRRTPPWALLAEDLALEEQGGPAVARFGQDE